MSSDTTTAVTAAISEIATALNEPVTEIDTVGPATTTVTPAAPTTTETAPTAGLLALAGLPLLGGGATPTGTPPTAWALLWWLRRNQDQSLLDDAQAASLDTATPTAGTEQIVATDTTAANQAPILVITPTSTDPTTGAVTYHVDIADPDSPDLPTVTLTELRHGSITDNGDGTVIYTPTAQARYAAGAENATDADRFEYVTVTATDPLGAATTVRVDVPITPSNSVVIDRTSTGGGTYSADGKHIYLTDYTTDANNTVTATTLTTVDAATGAVTETVVVPGQARTPAVDAATGRRYVVSTGNSTTFFTAIDPTAGTAGTAGTNTVPTGSNVSNPTLSPDGSHAYLASSQQIPSAPATQLVLTTIDTATGAATTTTIPSNVFFGGANGFSSQTQVTADGEQLYVVTNSPNSRTGLRNGAVTVVQLATGTAISTALTGQATRVVFTPDGEHAYITGGTDYDSEGVLTLVTADTGTATVIASGGNGGAGFGQGKGLVLTPDGSHAYFAYYGTDPATGTVGTHVVLVDTATGTATTVYSTAGRRADIAVTPDGQQAFVSTITTVTSPGGSATFTELTSIDTATGAAATILSAPGGAESGRVAGLVMAADGQHVFLTTQDGTAGNETTTLTAVDTATHEMTSAYVAVGTEGLAQPTPDGSYVYLSVRGADGSTQTTIVDTATAAIIGPIPSTSAPILTTDGAHAYVYTNTGTPTLTAIDTTTGVTSTVYTGTDPISGVTLGPDGDSLLVSTRNATGTDYTVTLIRTAESTNQAPVLVVTPTAIDPATGAVTYHVDIADPDGTDLPAVTVSDLVHGSITDNGDGTVTYTPTPAARYAAGNPDATDADKFEYVTVTATDPLGAATTIHVTVPIAPLYPYAPDWLSDSTTVAPGGRYAFLVHNVDGDEPQVFDGNTQVTVLDQATGATSSAMDIPGIRFTAGLVAAPDGEHAYLLTAPVPVSNSSPLYFTVIDAGTNTFTTYTTPIVIDKTESVGRAILSPDGSHLYLVSSVLDDTTSKLTTHLRSVDPSTGAVTDIVDVPGVSADTGGFDNPGTYMSVSPDGRYLYLTTAEHFDDPDPIPVPGPIDDTYHPNTTYLTVVDTVTGSYTTVTSPGEPSLMVITPAGAGAWLVVTEQTSTHLIQLDAATGAALIDGIPAARTIDSPPLVSA